MRVVAWVQCSEERKGWKMIEMEIEGSSVSVNASRLDQTFAEYPGDGAVVRLLGGWCRDLGNSRSQVQLSATQGE